MYPEEQRVGNEFEVDVVLNYKAPSDRITSIEQTINYAEVFRMVKECFMERQQLLETIALEIAGRIQEHFPNIEGLTISIKKLTPPITGFIGTVGITYSKSIPPIS